MTQTRCQLLTSFFLVAAATATTVMMVPDWSFVEELSSWLASRQPKKSETNERRKRRREAELRKTMQTPINELYHFGCHSNIATNRRQRLALVSCVVVWLVCIFHCPPKKTKRWLICACASLLAWCIVTIKCWNSKEEQNDKQTISRTHTVYYTRFGPGCCQSLPKMTFDHLGSYRTGTCRSILSLTDHIFNWDHLGLASSLENKFKIKRKSKFLPPNTIQIGQSATIDR